MKNTISTHYEPPQQTKLVNKVNKLNVKVYNAIQKANVNTVDDLLAFVGAFVIAEFAAVRTATKGYLGVVEQDIKTMSNSHDLTPNKQLINKMQSQTYIELNSNLVCAEKELMQELKAAAKPFKKNPTHIVDIKTVLQNEFIKNGGVKVTYKNGARMPLDKYFMMATRTARSETQNAASIDDAIKLGTDYVYMAPCNSSCKTCAALGNRVYCISGKDTAYPSVYGVLFKNGYNCIHPHCRCVLRPFFVDNHTKEKIEELKQASNRDYDLDPRNEQQRQQYQDSQAFNHRVWDAQKKFTKAKEVLGPKLPSQLNTKAKFQTAHAKQTPRYQATMQKVKFVEKRNALDTILTKTAVDGKIKIKGTDIYAKQDTVHLIDQINARHISVDNIEQAFNSKPLLVGELKYNKDGLPSHKIVYENITIYVNPENGNITTIHRTHRNKVKQLKGGKDGN